MATVALRIVGDIVDHFEYLTPKCLQHRPSEHVKPEVRNEYLRNYRYQKFLSFATLSTASVCALKAVHLLATGPVSLMVLALSVSALVLGKIWCSRANDPRNLARVVSTSIFFGPKQYAIELLKKGADLDFRAGLKGTEPYSLFELASKSGQNEVLKYFMEVGVDLSQAQALQVAQSVKTVQFLLEDCGIPPNNPGKKELSPLAVHLLKAKQLKDMRCLEVVEECKIIQFLHKKGAALQTQDYRSMPKGERTIWVNLLEGILKMDLSNAS